MSEIRSAYEIVVRNPGRERLLGRPRRRWEDGIILKLMLSRGYEGAD
jgi:hypothetical protein